MTTLKLILTDKWFEEVKSGRKTHEYREVKPFWRKRLQNKDMSFKDYKCVEFQKAYRKNAEKMTFVIEGISVVDGLSTDLKIDNWVFNIELGSRVND